ncbi:hypothetical protein AVEN_134787-1 [Araneus ventricosus]|uniref:Uncharacterized protein n=1 Tax=Araneus ventricosus TaxID=182803 RepID=A0A4Y2GBR0_ARAVE|nr:hypothetical protein AVEN_134787-1 [Araneus ventricosus]
MLQVKQRLTSWSKEHFIFFTRHGAFGEGRFWFLPTSYCACGKHGSPLHYVTDCDDLTESWQLWKPESHLENLWFQRVMPMPNLVTEKIAFKLVVDVLGTPGKLFRFH